MVGITVMAILFMLVGGFTAFLAIAGRDKRNKYDERQLIEQGRGFKYATITMVVYEIMMPIFEISSRRKFMETNVALWLCACLGLAVFAVYCIIKDAYVTVKTSPWVQTCVMGLLAVTYTVSAIMRLDGGLVEDGMLTLSCANFAIAAVFIVIFLTLLIKNLLDRRRGE